MTNFYELQFFLVYHDINYQNHIFHADDSKDIVEARRKVINYFIETLETVLSTLESLHHCEYKTTNICNVKDDIKFLNDAADHFIQYGAYIYSVRKFIFKKIQVTEIT